MGKTRLDSYSATSRLWIASSGSSLGRSASVKPVRVWQGLSYGLARSGTVSILGQPNQLFCRPNNTGTRN
jgi:hypothetical protein